MEKISIKHSIVNSVRYLNNYLTEFSLMRIPPQRVRALSIYEVYLYL